MTTSRENILTKGLSKLGFNKRMNYTNVMKLLESNNLMEDFLYAIKATSKPEHVKLLRILNRVSLTQDETVLSMLAENFSKDVQKIDQLNDFPKFKKWAIGISHSDSIESFMRKLPLMPTDVPPKVVDRFWRSYIIPTSSKNIKPFMSRSISKSFNKLISNYNKDLFGDFAQSLDVDISPSMHKRFVDYIFDSMSGVGVCQTMFRKKGSNLPLLIAN
jgi:hypothetical protein